MSKKTKRQTRRVITPASPAEYAAPASRVPEFNPDYSNVIKDLRRIGMLAGTFIVLLVVLSFFLN